VNENAPSPDTAVFEEVLAVLQQYLSDLVPPLMLVNEGEALLRVPPVLLSIQIERWVAAQYRSGENTPVSDYLYHVARKSTRSGTSRSSPRSPSFPFSGI